MRSSFACDCGGLSLALVRAFTIIDPHTKDLGTKEWERLSDLGFAAVNFGNLPSILWVESIRVTEVFRARNPCLQPLRPEQPYPSKVLGQHRPLRKL
jgi:hypothetical protein